MAKEITEATVVQITQTVRQTYQVQREDVQKEVDNIVAGNKPQNIIGMLVHGMLDRNGYLEEDEEEYDREDE